MRKQPPKEIYLQFDPDGGETTWCEDKINDDDIEYVRKSRAEKAERELAALKAKISPAENEAYEIINLLSSGQPNKYKYTDQTGWGLYFWWDVAKQDMQRVFEALKGGE